MTENLHMPTAKAIEKHLGITTDELISTKRCLAYANARAIYYRLRQLQEPEITLTDLANEVNRKHSTVINALRPSNIRLVLAEYASEYGRILRQLKLKDSEFKKHRLNETTNKPTSRPPNSAISRVFCRPEKRAIRYVFNEESQSAKTLHGFNFSLEEDQAISRVCNKAAEYMKAYGRGETLRPIDLSHYEQQQWKK